jgi:hypothetical protein
MVLPVCGQNPLYLKILRLSEKVKRAKAYLCRVSLYPEVLLAMRKATTAKHELLLDGSLLHLPF